LVIKDEAGVPETWDASNGWRMSYAREGSPGSEDLLVGFPGELLSLIINGDGHVQLDFSGDDGRPYVFEGSADLVNWDEISTFTTAGGSATLVDPDIATETRRFYRVRLIP
jgi:hypothetical protein